jgi:hypothetical protein
MAIWTITSSVEVLYRLPGGRVESCGRADSRNRTDAEAWVMANANPWDFVHTPTGTWVRLVDPGVPA